MTWTALPDEVRAALRDEKVPAWRSPTLATVVVRLPSPLSLNNTYPELVDALAKQDTSFVRLQGRLGITDPEEAKASGIAVFYYVCCV